MSKNPFEGLDRNNPADVLKAAQMAGITRYELRKMSPMMNDYLNGNNGQSNEQEDQPGVISDLWSSFGVGAGNLVSAAGSLYGLATGDMDNGATRLGEQVSDYWNKEKSNVLTELEQGRRDAINNSDSEFGKFGNAIWETVSNPRLLASFVSEQIPMFAVPGGAGAAGAKAGTAYAAKKGTELAAKKFGSKVGVAAGVGTGAAMQGGDVGANTYEELIKLPEPVWEQNPEYLQLKDELGNAEAAKEQIALSYGRKASAIAGTLSIGSQFIPGGATIEKAMAGNKFTGGLMGRVAKGFAGEGAQEIIEEGGGKVISNSFIDNIDENQSLFEGVGESSGLGLLGGGVMGGTMAAISGAPNIESTKQQYEAKLNQLRESGKKAVAEGDTAAAQQIDNDFKATQAAYTEFLKEYDPGFVSTNLNKQQQAKADKAAQGGDALDQELAAAQAASTIADDVAKDSQVKMEAQQGLMGGMNVWQPNFTMPGSEQEQARQVDGEYIANTDFPNSVPLGNTLGFNESVGAIDAMPENRINQSDTIFTGEQREELPAPQRLGLPDKYTNTIQAQDRTAELDAQEQMRQAQNAPRQTEQKDIIFGEDNRFNQGTERATVRSNGNPFPTVKSTQASRSYRQAIEDGLNPEIVKVGNGFGWETQEDVDRGELFEAEAVTEQAEVAQPITETSIIEQPQSRTLLDTGRTSTQARPTKAVTPQGREVSVQYRVVDASEVINSNDENGIANPDFPREYQNRDRGRDASIQQIRSIANNLNPEQVDYGNMSTDGAPIVSPDGIVESGNGRVAGIKLAYKQRNAEKYRNYLEQQGYDVEGIKEPILVRVRTTDMTPEERREFVKESNERTTLSLSATEKAKDDASIISRIATDFTGGDIDSVANAGFVRKFMQGISSTEAAELTDAQGRLSQTGKRRIEAALLFNAYGDERVVTDLFESSDNDIKSIGGAMLDNAGQWAKMRQQAPTELDMTNNVIEAVNLVKQARREGRNVAELVSQQDIFSGEISPETDRALRMMYGPELKRAVSRKALSEKLSQYATLASNVNPEPGLFGDEVDSVSSNDLMDQINGTENTTNDFQESLFNVEDSAGRREEGEQPSGNDTLTEDNQSLREPEPQEVATQEPPEGGFFTPEESEVTTEELPKVIQSGVEIELPVVSKETESQFNMATHTGRGRDFNKELKDSAEFILTDLEERGLLDTPERKEKAKELIQDYLEETKSYIGRESNRAANNPSWIITGRGNLDLDKYNKKAERQARSGAQEAERLDTKRKSIISKVRMVMNDEQKNQAAEKRKAEEKQKSVLDFANELGAMQTPGLTKSAFMPRAKKAWARIVDSHPGEIKQVVEQIESSLAKSNTTLKDVLGARSGLWKEIEGTLEQQAEPIEQVESDTQEVAKENLTSLEPVNRYDALWDRANEGDTSLSTEDVKGAYQALLQNEESVKAELKGLTKKQLLKYYNGFHDSGMNKQELIDSAYDDMLKSFRFLGTTDEFVSSSMVFGAKGIERYDNVTRDMDNLTDEKLREVITARKKRSDERSAEMKARVDGMKNPETLEDFRNAARYGLSKNFTNAQWAKYDSLVADEQMERQSQRAQREVQAFDGEVNYNLHETTHSKKGHDLFVVEMVERLPSDKYKELNQKAKALGGYYSSYRRDGAIPGFQFPSEEARTEFVQVMNGESVTKTKQSKDKTDSLLGLAERIEEKANDELNRDRKTNTAKRAGEAASAIESAESNLVRAEKLKALANAIKNGETKYLNKVTAGTDQELLESLWNQIWYRARNNDEYTEDAGQGRWQRERKWKKELTDIDKVRLAEYPLTNMYPGMVKRVAKEMIDTKGYALAGKSLLKLAESSGGDTKQVNVLANKHHEKMMEFLRKNAETEYGREIAKDYMRIKRMGLNNLPTLRAALLEYKSITDNVGEVKTNSAVKDKLKYEEIRGQYKDLDFFNSTDVVAKEAMNYLELEEGMTVLEPSAGVGHLADAAAEVVGKSNVTTNEFAFGLNEFLKEKGYTGTQGDFLALNPDRTFTFGDIFEAPDGTQGIMRGSNGDRVRLVDENGESVGPTRYYSRSELKGVEKRGVNSGFDRVLMNPPFSKDQEITHIEHAYKFLKPGGRLVAVTSSMAGKRSNKRNQAFKAWLDEVGAFEVPLPEGAFKDAINPTNVNAKIIVIDKPEDSAMFSLANNTNPTTTRNRASVSSADANKVIDSIISSWTGGIKARRNEFVVASTYDDLPSDIKDAAKQQGAENNVWGVFHKGKTYVVLDKHNSTQELETTIFHETYGHHGMRKLFGNEITQKMNQLFVANGGISGLRKSAEKHGIDLSLYERGTEKAGMSPETRNRVLMEELLAHMQQDNKPSVKRMAKEVVGYIRQKLRDLGFAKLANVSDSDLFYILKQSRDAVVKGSVNGGDTMFMIGNVSKEQLMAEGLNDPREIAYQESILETLKSSDNAFDIRKAEALERKLDLAKATFSNEEQNDTASDDAPKSFTLKPDGIIKDTGDYYSVSIKDNNSGVESKYRLNKNPDDGYYVAEEQENGEWSYYNEYESLQEFADSIDDINEYLGQDRKNENFSGSASGTPLFRTMDDSAPQSFTAPVEKKWSKDWFKRKLQDKFAPIKDMQASIENFTGEELPEDQDTYRAEELFYGKTENDLNKMEQNHVKPLVDAMTQNNIESGELDQYLIAKHAKERNAHIASINPEMPDGGSGMTNAEADEILSRYEQEGKLAGLSIAANEVYKITEKRRELLRESGLEDEALIDVWDANYQFYVPLKGYANDSEGTTVARTGKGFDIRGRESMRAMGRRTIAESPTAHAIQDLSETIIRSRKNEVGKTFLNMVEANPNPDIWEVFTDENPDTERRIVNGEVKENQPIDMRSRKDDYFSVKVDGKSKYIKLKDKDKLLLTAMKNMGPAQVNGFTKAMGAATRWLSMVNTSLNPEFTVTNFLRDIQTAAFNAVAEQDLADGKVKGKRIAKEMSKGAFKAVRALYKFDNQSLTDESRMYDKPYKEWIEEFLEDGAKTGYFDSKDVDQIGKDMSSLLDMTKGASKGKLLKAKNKISDYVENLNGSVENGVRLSAYIEARRAGVTRNKAASFAKNLTVNFNRKGEAGTFLNSVYMFFNAAVQGNVNFARAILTPKVDEVTGKKSLNKAQKIAAGIVGASFGWASLMREIGGEDEDGVPYWDKIPKGVRERSFVILKPGTDGEYFKIPLPYGYNIFYNIGDAMEAAVQSDTRTKGDLAAELALSAYASFIPLGSPVGDNEAESAALVATPTLFKPIVEIATNKNFFGGQIYRENMPYGPELRDSQMSMRSTGEMYKGIARWMNDVMGDGMKYKVDGEAPLYDISPDTIEHIVEFGLGGLYRFGSRMADTVGTVSNGGELDVTSTPFIRQVNGEIRPYEDISNFYDARQELKNIEAELKSRKGKARMEFMQEYRDKYRLRGLMSSIDKRMKLLRKQRDRIEIDDSLSFVEREERLQRIEDKMKSAVATFNEKWNETE